MPENAGTKGSGQAGAVGWTRSGVDASELGPRRLRSLERMCDDHSFATLGALGITPQLRCLDIGAGAGSVASWLAERVPQGEVVATELDIAFLPDDIANLHPLEHDVLTDDFEPASFDLIHSRAVFQVFPDAAGRPAQGDPVAQTGRLAGPGGDRRRTWPAIADAGAAAGQRVDPRLPRARGRGRPRARSTGSQCSSGRSGSRTVGATYRAHAVGAGSPAQDLIRLSLAQLRPGALRSGLGTEQEFDELDSWLGRQRRRGLLLRVDLSLGTQAIRPGRGLTRSPAGLSRARRGRAARPAA